MQSTLSLQPSQRVSPRMSASSSPAAPASAGVIPSRLIAAASGFKDVWVARRSAGTKIAYAAAAIIPSTTTLNAIHTNFPSCWKRMLQLLRKTRLDLRQQA